MSYTPEWYESSSEVAHLFDWLVEHDLIDKDPGSISYFLHKPWKWDEEYRLYIAGLAVAKAVSP